MPTYLYKREDGSTFEIEQRITAPVLETCPTTGQPVKRLISKGAGLIFKGSGFYLTDYVRSADGSQNSSDRSGSPPSEDSSSEPGAGDSKSADKQKLSTEAKNLTEKQANAGGNTSHHSKRAANQSPSIKKD